MTNSNTCGYLLNWQEIIVKSKENENKQMNLNSSKMEDKGVK